MVSSSKYSVQWYLVLALLLRLFDVCLLFYRKQDTTTYSRRNSMTPHFPTRSPPRRFGLAGCALAGRCDEGGAAAPACFALVRHNDGNCIYRPLVPLYRPLDDRALPNTCTLLDLLQLPWDYIQLYLSQPFHLFTSKRCVPPSRTQHKTQ